MAPPSTTDSRHEIEDYWYRVNAVWGTVTADGQPRAGATITVVGHDEANEIEANGEYALQLPEGEYGPPPHQLLFSMPGYQPQTHTVTITEEGVELNVDLEPAR